MVLLQLLLAASAMAETHRVINEVNYHTFSKEHPIQARLKPGEFSRSSWPPSLWSSPLARGRSMDGLGDCGGTVAGLGGRGAARLVAGGRPPVAGAGTATCTWRVSGSTTRCQTCRAFGDSSCSSRRAFESMIAAVASALCSTRKWFQSVSSCREWLAARSIST